MKTSRRVREYCLKFLYQNELQNFHFYSRNKMRLFLQHFKVNEQTASFVATYVEGILDRPDHWDKLIARKSANWSFERIAIIDKMILRLAVYELVTEKEPASVVINEALELAKVFGTENSRRFVNGILDAVASELQASGA